MAIIKCKMCGGDMKISPDSSFGTCEYCGTTMTLPKVNDEQRAAAFNRGNHFHRIGEFDKALAVYEGIVREDEKDAEAHWCCALCRFGIEYVKDPATGEYLPTCHRASFDNFLEDVDYQAALKYADVVAREQYQKDGEKIAEVQHGILATVQKERPFDVFICYKETGEDAHRTIDSTLAQDIYYQLTEQGHRVFFARITLEDKAGVEYEPYIFAALQSAKVMLVVGTKPEYFNAVWVRNEWSRFLALMKQDRKKLLIPCYRDMDPYDLPEQLSVLQSYDMGKIGFIQDLIRSIRKIVSADAPQAAAKETVAVNENSAAGPLLERAFLFLEDGKWQDANTYCEKVLDIAPKNAEAYLGKLMAELQVKKREELADCAEPFDNMDNYNKVMRFADEKLKTVLVGYLEHINTRNKKARMDGIYNNAKKIMARAYTESNYKEAAHLFESISEYQDSTSLAKECYEKAEVARKDTILAEGNRKMTGTNVSNYEFAIKIFASIPGWKDADEKVSACQKKIEEIRLEEKKRKNRTKKIVAIATPIICVCIAFVIVLNVVIIPNANFSSYYNQGQNALAVGDYRTAVQMFMEAKGYQDSADLIRSYNLQTISASYNTTVGVKTDGTVVAVGNNDDRQCNVDYWTDIVAASAGVCHTVGLRSDGTVVAAGGNVAGQCDVEGWTDIVAVSAGDWYTVGLKYDGTVVAAGGNGSGQCDVEGWTDIVAVSAGDYYTVGLKSDGTVVAVGDNHYGQCNVEDWTDIVAVSAGVIHTVGLKSDGTVVVAGSHGHGMDDVEDWTDIVAVSAGNWHTVGLKSDGTVVATSDSDDYGDYGQRDVEEWTDIVAISAGNWHTVGLKSDGTVVATGYNDDGQCNVGDWTNIKTLNR